MFGPLLQDDYLFVECIFKISSNATLGWCKAYNPEKKNAWQVQAVPEIFPRAVSRLLREELRDYPSYQKHLAALPLSDRALSDLRLSSNQYGTLAIRAANLRRHHCRL